VSLWRVAGLLKSASPEILAACLSLPTLNIVEPTQTSRFCFAARGSPDSRLTLNLLDWEDGQPHIAQVARVLATACSAGHLDSSDIRQPLLSEKLGSETCLLTFFSPRGQSNLTEMGSSAGLIPEPDLLLVLGGTQLKLHGFPPWHLRLTDI
jgi:dehydrodolichyl diphosphate syntase complex subunit NUS1